MFGKHIFVTVLITVLCQLIEVKSFANKTPDYSDCDITVQCFGLPDKCVDTKSCVVLLKTLSTETGATFTLFWERDPNSKDSYVAAALSTDQKMGDDTVTEFIVQSNNTIISRQGLTYCTGNGCGVNTVDVKGINNVKTDYSDGLLAGQWTRITDTTVTTFDFNILTQKYFIFLAYGPVDAQGNLLHHTDQWVSPSAVFLEQRCLKGINC